MTIKEGYSESGFNRFVSGLGSFGYPSCFVIPYLLLASTTLSTLAN